MYLIRSLSCIGIVDVFWHVRGIIQADYRGVAYSNSCFATFTSFTHTHLAPHLRDTACVL